MTCDQSSNEKNIYALSSKEILFIMLCICVQFQGKILFYEFLYLFPGNGLYSSLQTTPRIQLFLDCFIRGAWLQLAFMVTFTDSENFSFNIKFVYS